MVQASVVPLIGPLSYPAHAGIAASATQRVASRANFRFIKASVNVIRSVCKVIRTACGAALQTNPRMPEPNSTRLLGSGAPPPGSIVQQPNPVPMVKSLRRDRAYGTLGGGSAQGTRGLGSAARVCRQALIFRP